MKRIFLAIAIAFIALTAKAQQPQVEFFCIENCSMWSRNPTDLTKLWYPHEKSGNKGKGLVPTNYGGTEYKIECSIPLCLMIQIQRPNQATPVVLTESKPKKIWVFGIDAQVGDILTITPFTETKISKQIKLK